METRSSVSDPPPVTSCQPAKRSLLAGLIHPSHFRNQPAHAADKLTKAGGLGESTSEKRAGEEASGQIEPLVFVDEEWHEHANAPNLPVKSRGTFFSGKAKKLIRIEVGSIESSLESRRVKMSKMFDPLDDFLASKGRLKTDEAFKKHVLQTALLVARSLLEAPETSLFAKEGGGRVETKHLFLSCLHLCLKQFAASRSDWLIELRLSDLLQCYSHLSVCLGTLSKCISSLKLHFAHLFQANSEDKMETFKSVFLRLANSVLDSPGKLHLPVGESDQGGTKEKVRKCLSRFMELHKEKLKEVLLHRPAVQNAVAVLYFVLNVMSPRLRLSDLLSQLVEKHSHLATVDYFAVWACSRIWRIATVKLFRSVCKNFSTVDKFVFQWNRLHPPNEASDPRESILPEKPLGLRPEGLFETAMETAAGSNLIETDEEQTTFQPTSLSIVAGSLAEDILHPQPEDNLEPEELLSKDERKYFPQIAKLMLKSKIISKISKAEAGKR